MTDPSTTTSIATSISDDESDELVETGPTNNDDVDESNDVAEEDPTQLITGNGPAGPIVVLEVDRLKAENLNLKLLNAMNQEAIIQGRIKDLQAQLNELNNQRGMLVTQMQTMRTDVEAKYNIDLTTHVIQPETGVVTPRPHAPGSMDSTAMAAAIQQMQSTKG